MTIPGANQVRHNMVVYPQTWRWVIVHLVWIIAAGIAYLLLTGFFA